MKVVLIILGVGGIVLLACCGGGFFLARKAADTVAQAVKDMTTDDPVKIRDMTASIVDVEVPDVYTPKMALTVPIIGMQMCFFTRADDSGGVVVMQMPNSASTSKAQMKQQFQQQMQQQNRNQQLTIESTETRMFTINGEECPFEFVKGRNSQNNEDMRQVSGIFPGKAGTAFLMVFEKEDNWDEEAIVRMIESMGGTDGSSSASPVMEESPPGPVPADAPDGSSSGASETDPAATPQ